MDIAILVLYNALLVFWFLLIVRLVVELIHSFAREWRPSGFLALIFEIIFTITDPPIKLFRKLIPPITLGPVRLDLSFLITIALVSFAMQILQSL